MSPRDVARGYALGRVAIGAALLAAPQRMLATYFGRDAERPAARVLGRGLGVRDVAMGAIALHTLDHPEVGPRWQRTCAAADAVDAVAMLAVRDSVSPLGLAGWTAIAGGAAALGLWTGQALATSAEPSA